MGEGKAEGAATIHGWGVRDAMPAAGRVVLVTEGGYHLRALAASLAASLSAMESGAKPDPVPGEGGGVSGVATAISANIRIIITTSNPANR